MAKTSGSVRGASKSGGREGSDSNYSGKQANIGSLKEIKDRSLQKDLQQGISKFESRLGVRTNVRLADAYGVHVTIGGKSAGVYLDRKSFQSKEQVIKAKKKAYDTGFSNRTNKPTQHTVVHELSHSLWTSHHSGSKHIKAGDEISKLYKTFKKDNPKSWGSYGKTNINEFFAEGITKGILGKPDKYTKSLIKIAKKYGL
jgi:hypothetical protein